MPSDLLSSILSDSLLKFHKRFLWVKKRPQLNIIDLRQVFGYLYLFFYFYVWTFDKNEKDKKYIKTDLVVTLVFFIILLVYIYWWKYIKKLSNNTVSKFQYISTTTNALETGRNMFR